MAGKSALEFRQVGEGDAITGRWEVWLNRARIGEGSLRDCVSFAHAWLGVEGMVAIGATIQLLHSVPHQFDFKGTRARREREAAGDKPLPSRVAVALQG